MKLFFYTLLVCSLVGVYGNVHAQSLRGQALIDSLLTELPKHKKQDTNRVYVLAKISHTYCSVKPTEGLGYGRQALKLAEDIGWKKGQVLSLSSLGINYVYLSKGDTALAYHQKARKIAEEIGYLSKVAGLLYIEAIYHIRKNDRDKAIEFCKRSLKIAEEIDDKSRISACCNFLGSVYKMSDYPMALEYIQRAMKVAEESNDKTDMLYCLNNMGDIYRNQGNYPEALDNFQKSLKIAEELGDKSNAIIIWGRIGEIYHFSLRDYTKALEYYENSLKGMEETEKKNGAAQILNNIGKLHSDQGNYTKALEYQKKALKLAEEIEATRYISMYSVSVGNVYVRLSNYPEALKHYQKALKIAEDIGSKGAIADATDAIGDLYLEMGKTSGNKNYLLKAVSYLKQSKQMHLELGLVQRLRSANLALYEAYKLSGNPKAALEAHEQYLIYKDSVFNKENTKKIARLEVKAEYEKKQVADSIQAVEAQKLADVKLQRQRTMTFGGIGAAVLLLAFSIFIFRNSKKLGIEKEKSETLLYNILPEEVASELKDRGATTAQQFDHVTVLFTDFVSFTTAGERMGSQALVEELHNCFKAFDEIMSRYGIEKIKTIGDAYLAVCGLPTADEQHAEKVVNAGKDILDFMLHRREQLGDKTFEIRIGIHSGEVVAGIVGVKKFAYDIWGDTVNTAARMEQNSVAGKINMSQTTYELVQDKFTCTYRGELEAKNKGKLKMYFVEA